MKTLFIYAVLLCVSALASADSIRKIDLQYRDALATKDLLVTLFKGDISMVVDANSLLVRGANADLQALATMVKRLDKPQQSLRVSLYRGVDPYRGDVDLNARRITTTHPHRDNVLDRWIMEDGTMLMIRDNVRVLDSDEQRVVEENANNGKALFTTKATRQRIESNEHKLRVTLTNDKQSVRLILHTQLANRAAVAKTEDESRAIVSTDIESRRMIPTKQWVRLFYRQAQENTFSPERKTTVTTALNFDDEQALWIFVEPLL